MLAGPDPLAHYDHAPGLFPGQGLVVDLGDLAVGVVLYRPPVRGRGDGSLDTGVHANVDGEGDSFSFEVLEDALGVKAAVGADGLDLYVPGQLGQGLAEELLDAGQVGHVSRAQPEIGDDFEFRDEREDRTVGRPARLFGVVAFLGSLLLAVAGEDRRVQIEGHGLDRLGQAPQCPFPQPL